MRLTPESTVADIVTASLGTIPVFQRHQIDFCCGGKVPLAQVCQARGLDVGTLLTELDAAASPAGTEPDWADATLAALVAYIQRRFHEPLRAELPRLGAMLDKVMSRHGDRLPETLPPLRQTFESLKAELLDHMEREDRVLFPAIVAVEAAGASGAPNAAALIGHASAVMEADHDAAGAALADIRRLTGGFAPPDWACPTFRGLYFGLAQFEADMHLHVHLENNVLFPRAVACARSARA